MRPTVLLFAFTLAIAAATPVRAGADQEFQGAGQRTSLDCDGGSIKVGGAGNELRITGACSYLQDEGASNRIQVVMAPNGLIKVEGAGNRIRWSAPAGKKPRNSASGADNQVVRAVDPN